jgi:uncharacterized protein YjbI with pentapeptide repeats
MTNPAHKQKLCQGPEAWNAWRTENPAITPDLCGLTLPLNGRHLTPAAEDESIDLTWAQLTGADLRFSTLIAANLCNASLAGTDFTSARLNHADFRGADLTGTTFNAADVDGTRFDGAILNGAVLVEARNLTQEQLDSAHGNDATLLPDGLTMPAAWRKSGSEGEAPAQPEPAQGASRKAKLPDLYAILGLAPTATDRQIQDAYRTMAKALHPDRFPGDRSIEDAFKCASSAADILLDPRQRKLYDRRELDVHGNRLPESIAQEAKGKRHGVFAAAFLMGLMALPLTYIAVTWSRHPAPQEAASDATKAQTNLKLEQLSSALEAEKALTRAETKSAAPKPEPAAEKHPGEAFNDSQPGLNDGQPGPGGGPALAAENQVIPAASAAPVSEAPAAGAAEDIPPASVPLPAGSTAPNPSGPLTATPASSDRASQDITPAQLAFALENASAPANEAGRAPDAASLQTPPRHEPEASPAAPADEETPFTAQPQGPLTLAEEDALLRKGAELMKDRRVSAARLCFASLAARGSARAAFAMGQTYDPAFLESLGIAGGVEPDAAIAKQWYDKAAKLGARSGERGLESGRRNPAVTGSLPQVQPVN